ncbi:MAG: DUF2232 domain-containing protein [Candidatus Riflebacteria bacterium]|nr:DUF2232 domain-containing protein [Candidatus Riflebacteria bacterium]
MAALSFLFFLGSSIPLLGVFFVLLCPVPLTLVGLRHGGRRSVLSCACAVFLVSVVIGGPVQGYLFLVPFGLVGVITGWMLTQTGSAARTILMGTLLMTLAVTPAVTFLEKAIGLQDFAEQSKQLVKSVIEAQSRQSLPPEARLELEQMVATLTTAIRFPLAPFFLFSMFLVYVNHLVSYKVFLRLGITVRAPPDPRRFRLPLWVVALYPIMWLGYARAGGPNGTLTSSLLLNGFFLAGQLTWLGGVTAAGRLLSPDRPVPVPACLLLAAVLLPLMPFAIMLGVGETVFGALEPRPPLAAREQPAAANPPVAGS